MTRSEEQVLLFSRDDGNSYCRCLGPWGVLGSNLRGRVNCSPGISDASVHTVKPLLRVVLSVLEP